MKTPKKEHVQAASRRRRVGPATRVIGFDVERIKREWPIQDFLEEKNVDLFPSGEDTLKARCPLPDHHDKTPSFTVYTKQGRFYCFGCEQGGDVINLVMAMEGVDFQEACRRLGATKSKVALRRRKALRNDPSDDRAKRLAESAGCLRDDIQRDYAWREEEIVEASGFTAEAMLCGSWKLLLATLFGVESVVWIGEPHHSGGAAYARNFKPVWQWLDEPRLPGWHTCPSTFKPEVYARTAENVLEHRYLVIESDQIIGKAPETEEEKRQNQQGCAALIRWMRDALGMELAAVVDTGNKSLHGWFRLPSAAMLEQLKVIAPELRIDAGLFKPAHPVRLPGAVHEKSRRTARLLYLREMQK